MTFDLAKVPGGDVAAWGAHCREKALVGVRDRDWRAIYDWTKSWIGWGGGAWLPDTWLLYAVSALIEGKPRGAVHSLDLGLKTWLAGDADRAVLTWCRGVIVMDRLADPKTALLDLNDAVADVPAWAESDAGDRLDHCRHAASMSRKRVASAQPRPAYEGAENALRVVAPPVGTRADGEEPIVWPAIEPFFRRAPQ